jgi:hypothetical protein
MTFRHVSSNFDSLARVTVRPPAFSDAGGGPNKLTPRQNTESSLLVLAERV